MSAASTPICCSVSTHSHGQMDAIDRKIVALLRENARRSFKDIGKHVHLTAPAVKRRVDRLEARRRDPRLHGGGRPGRVRLARRGLRRPLLRGPHAGRGDQARRGREPAVVSAHTVAGEASAILHVMARGHPGPRAGARADPQRRRASTGPSPRSCSRRCSSGEAPLPRRPAALDPRLLRLRGARAQRARRPRPRGARRLVRDPGLLLLEPGRGLPRRRRGAAAGRHARCSTTSSSWPP